MMILLLSLLAHDENWSDSQVRIEGDRVVWRVTVGTLALGKVMRFPSEITALTEEELRSVKGEIAGHLRRGLAVEAGGRALEPEAGALTPLYQNLPVSGEPWIESVVQEFVFRAPEQIDEVLLVVDFFGSITETHASTVSVTWGDGEPVVREQVGRAEIRMGTPWAMARRHGMGGLRHVLLGGAYTAFVLAVLLGTTGPRERWRAAAGYVLAGTAAYAAPLSVRPAVLQALLAASVLYAGAENLVVRSGAQRWIVAAVFGAVHGLALSGMAPPEGAAAFGTGAALGVAAVALVGAPATAFLGTKARLAASVPLALLGACWLIEALAGAPFLPLGMTG